MTGPEHYAAAEELLDLAANMNGPLAGPAREELLSEATIHAMLAQVAATALVAIDRPDAVLERTCTAWREVIATPNPNRGDQS